MLLLTTVCFTSCSSLPLSHPPTHPEGTVSKALPTTEDSTPSQPASVVPAYDHSSHLAGLEEWYGGPEYSIDWEEVKEGQAAGMPGKWLVGD